MSFVLGVGGAHLGKVVRPGGTRMGATNITADACLPERMSEGYQTLLPRDDSALSAVKFLLSGKELVLQFSDHCRGGYRGPTQVNKQRLTSQQRNKPRKTSVQDDSPG
jgi:hypothetical protein